KDTKPIALSDVAEIIRESEERMKTFIKEEIKSVTDRLTVIETNVSLMQTECVRFDEELSKIKKVLSDQHLRVEEHERMLRVNNIIIHNIPEEEVSSDSVVLEGDVQKIEHVCESARLDIDEDDFAEIQRIGKRQPNKIRPIKITLRSTKQKFKLLNNRRHIVANDHLTKLFGNKIFINPDNSLVVQKEEQLLRSKAKELKDEYPNVATYIRSGKLYHDGRVIDSVDVRNQLL
ncbi:MAG: hypothetical protein AAGK05_13455, partial [Pseudomonadota bacterium]